jgi:hypothetical protein
VTGRNIIFFVMNFYITLPACSYLKCKCSCASCIRGPGFADLHNVDEGFTELVGLCEGSAIAESLRHTAVGDGLASVVVGGAAVNDTVDLLTVDSPVCRRACRAAHRCSTSHCVAVLLVTRAAR